MESKLEHIRSSKDSLQKQNDIYKADIDNYQARLDEKKQIIPMMLNQRKELTV